MHIQPLSRASASAVSFLAFAVLAGCGRPILEPARPAPGHPAVPFAAAQLSTEWEPSPSKAYTTLPGGGAGRNVPDEPVPPAPPVPVLAASRVTDLLPAPPKGWWAEQVNIEHSLVADKTHYQTMASRNYAKSWAPGAQSVGLAIRIDWAGGSTFKDELDATCAEFGAHCKPVTTALGNGHAVEVEASRSTEIAVLVQGNLVAQAWGQNVSPAELQAWLERIPADRLGKLVLKAE